MKRRKYKSIITRRIWKSARKLGAAFLVLAMFSSFMAMRGTNSGFSDEEKSENNTFTATSLDARVSYEELFNVTAMTPGTSPTGSHRITFSNDGSLDFKYKIKYRKTGGDSELCDALLLTAERNGTKVYNKQLLKDFNLADFSGNPFLIAVSGNDSWNFKLELPANAGKTLESKNCQFNFDFSAWQTDFTDNTLGFTDEETEGVNIVRTGSWLTAGDVVINEIMWMGSTESTADEWIELRNMTGQEIDLSNWDIQYAGTGASGHIEIPSGYSINPNGYFLITKKKWDETAIKLSEDLEKDEGYTHVAGMSLNNDGEPLILKDENRNIIDTAWKYADWPAGSNGTLKQSMERNDIPGDGTLAGSWHTCASGLCNSGTFWDTADGNNYGTPGAANLSPIVMNEFVANPADGGNQWAELYNLLDEDADVAGWYFKNSAGDKIMISKDNTDSGKTIVPGKGMLVVDLGNDFLDRSNDTLSFYNGRGTPDDEDDDVKEDAYKYASSTKIKGDSFMRIPDGVGIWIDPEATPGEENKLADDELDSFRLLAYEKCFDGEDLKEDFEEQICAPAFLQYLEMIEDLDDKNIKNSTLLDILNSIIDKEEKILAALLQESAALNAGELPAADEPILILVDDTPSETAAPEAVEDVAVPEEEATIPKEEPIAEKIEEAPADEPKEEPVIETPAN